MNGIDYLDRGWRAGPETVCMTDALTGETATYDQVRTRTLIVANALLKRGYGEKSRGAVIGFNDIATFTVFLSLTRAGVAAIPVNPRNSPKDNAWMLDAFDCDILFFLSAFADIIPEIAKSAPNIREYVCLDGAEGYVSLEEWTAGFAPEPFDLPHDPDRIYLIQPTGGTTGQPKGVMVANRGMENHVANLSAVAPCDGRPVFLAAAPLTHAARYVMQTIMSMNGSAVLFSKPDKQLRLESIPRYGVTHTFLPPTVIYDLIETPGVRDHDYSSLRYFIYGASPMSPEKAAKAIDIFGPVLCQVYGQSETSFPNTYLSPEDHMSNGAVASSSRLASCGRETPFCRMAIVEDGVELPDGEVGEFAIRSSGLMLGYYKAPEQTEEVRKSGWHLTGDVGYRDSDGFFYIVDRKKDMIVSGGFNIYSVEVETALMSHPAVQNAAVIGIPHEKWGEMVAAEVELMANAEVTDAELIQHCKDLIGSMKSPKQVVFVDQLPRSPLGKILKRDIRQKYWREAERMVN